MLKWKGIDKSLLLKHRWILLLWALFAIIVLIHIFIAPFGYLNLFFSKNYYYTIGTFAKYYTYLGEEWLLIPIGLILLFFVKSINFTIRLIFTFIINTAITVVTKFYLFDSDRPRIVLQKFNLIFTDGVDVHQFNSFPSGHSSAAFAMALALAFWFNNKILSAFLLILAIGVGFSRIYLQQHFIEDVLGGALVGLIAALLASGFYWVNKVTRKLEN